MSDECTRYPGRIYPTRQDAEAAILDRRIKHAVTSGSAGPGTERVKGCRCGGYHVVPVGKPREQVRKERQRAGNRR